MMMQCNKTFVAYHYYNLQLHEYCSILLLLSCKPYIVVVPYQRISSARVPRHYSSPSTDVMSPCTLRTRS